MPNETQMRQVHKARGRESGAPWRIDSKYPFFEIFRAEYVSQISGYSKPYLRRIAFGAVGVPDRLVISMQLATGWTIDYLFGSEFLKEWQVDHPKAK